ncbi:MAG: glycosyltransferase [Syntrophothermus sp.]
MRICLISSEREATGGLGIAVMELARALGLEHEVTVVHSYEDGPGVGLADGPTPRHVFADLSRLPPIAFACDDHARSAAVLAAIEDVYGDEPPDYLEAPDRRGHGLLPLQARNGGHRSLRGTTIAVRLHGTEELMALRDGNWPPSPQRMVFDLEREALRLADRVLWPGGDVLGLYRRVLDAPGLARAFQLRLPLEPVAAPPPHPREAGEPLRILYAGCLRRGRGALALAEACLGLERPDWRLTLVGPDSETAPLAQSTRASLEVLAAGEERIEVLPPLPRARLRTCYPDYDLFVLPAADEVWSMAALEAMYARLPVLATRVGGLDEIVVDGVSGWHLPDPSPASIRDGLELLLADRAGVERVRRSGAPSARARELTDPGMVRAGYRRLFAELEPTGPGRRRSAPTKPLVTGLVTYFGEHQMIRGAVASLLDQTYPELEVVVVNDGHFDRGDEVLFELAELDRVRVLHQLNRGETGARNLGLVDAEGAYVAVLDADNTYEPEFVERAVTMLEADPELAYVTCWLRFFDDGDGAVEALHTAGYPALGNGVRSDESINSDGDTMAVLPRRLFSRLGYRFQDDASLLADWEFYRELREGGRFGAVIPEFLANYRVRADSLSQTYFDLGHRVSWDESISRRRAAALDWMGAG